MVRPRLCGLLVLLCAELAAAEPRLRVGVDKRIELLSILFRLAGSPEYRRATGPYAEAVDRHFAPFQDHPAVQATRALRAQHGISYNAVPDLAIQLDDGFRLPGPLSPQVDARWQAAPVAAYLEAVRDFAAKSDYDGFRREQAAYFAAVEKRFQDLVAGQDLVGWFEALFGAHPKASYALVPGLLTGPMNYGVHAGDAIVEVMNLEAIDAQGLPHPGEMTEGLLAHELAHSFVNPVVDVRTWDAVEPAYQRVHDAMAKQAYTKLNIFVDESVVRAVTVLYLRDHVGADAARRDLALDERLQFRCTSQLADALDATRKGHAGHLAEAELVDAARTVLGACR
jgi:hypothetical protein